MYFQINSGQSKRTLSEDDLEGIRVAYPPTATPTPTPTPIPGLDERVTAPLLARD
jgi:hypothetical protein